jgi:hypothetical protein
MLVRVRRSKDRCKSFVPCHDYLGFGGVSQPFHVLGVGTPQIISLPLTMKLFPNLTEFKVTLDGRSYIISLDPCSSGEWATSTS